MMEEERKRLKIYCFQRRIIASQIYGDDFIEKVEKAFAETPRPNLYFFAGSFNHNQDCEECRAANDFFSGKKWQECTDDEAFRQLGSGQCFLYARAWHYFLPAYLIKLIKQARFSNGEFEQYLEEDSLETAEWQRERIDLLTSEQCKVIIDYLVLTLKVWEGVEKGFQDDTKTLDFWRENHRKALAKEQNVIK